MTKHIIYSHEQVSDTLAIGFYIRSQELYQIPLLLSMLKVMNIILFLSFQAIRLSLLIKLLSYHLTTD